MVKKGNTPALALLRRRRIEHTVHTYQLDSDGDSYGEAVAAELGVDPRRLFKTLVAVVDGDPVVAIVPVSGRLSLKSLARAAHGKRASMADPADAERWTGYVTGGISPFGQKRRSMWIRRSPSSRPSLRAVAREGRRSRSTPPTS